MLNYSAPKEPIGCPATGPNLRFPHVSMSVANPEAQQRWYQEALGFTDLIEDHELPDDPVRTVVRQCHSGLRLELMEAGGSSHAAEFSDPLDAWRFQGYAQWALEVDDLEHAFVQHRLRPVGAPKPPRLA